MKLSYYLIAIFLLAMIIATAVNISYFYYYSQNYLKIGANNHVNLAVSSSAEHIKTYLKEEKELIETIAESNYVLDVLSPEKNLTFYILKKEKAEQDISRFFEIEENYKEIFILDTKGIKVLSTNKKSVGEKIEQDPIIFNNLTKIYITDAYLEEATGDTQIEIYFPIKNLSGNVIGFFVTILKTDILNQIVSKSDNLGDSGEIIIVDNQKYPLTPLKYQKDSVLTFKLETELVNKCIENINKTTNLNNPEAMDAQEIVVYNDYRGEKIIGAYSSIFPEKNWCIIAKMDKSEAIDIPTNKLIINSIILSTFILFIISILLILLSKKVSTPIKKLTEDINKITKGDLEVQLKNSKINEFQSLIDSLNRILSSLKLAILRTGISKIELGLGEAIKAKEEAEEKLNLFYETSNDAIILFDSLNWRFVSANPAAVKMFKVSDERELISMSFPDLSPKYQADKTLSSKKAEIMIDEARNNGKKLFDWDFKTPSGEDLPTKVLLIKLKMNGKDVLQATVKDLSKEKIAEEKFQTLASATQEVVVMWDIKQRIIFWNKPAEKLFGVKENDAMGRSIDLFIPEDLQKNILEIQDKFKDKGITDNSDTLKISKYNLNIKVSPIKNDNAEIVGFSLLGKNSSFV